MLFFFTNLGLMGFQVSYLALFFSLVTDSFRQFLMESLHKNIQLTLEQLLKAQFIIIHFSFHRLMPSLTMLSVTILFMLMILLSTLSARRHLIYGLETGGTEDWGRKWLVDFNAENT